MHCVDVLRNGWVVSGVRYHLQCQLPQAWKCLFSSIRRGREVEQTPLTHFAGLPDLGTYIYSTPPLPEPSPKEAADIVFIEKWMRQGTYMQ